MKKSVLSIAVLLLFGIAFIACKQKAGAEKIVFSIKGSDTMVNLAQKWAEVYMQQNPSVSIQVTGGGSGTGIAALANGTTNIACSSRELKDKEKELFISKKINLDEVAVALDGLAIIVHPSNPIDSITIEDARKIFTGEAKNFKDFGGKSSPITLYGRENSSGTYEFFKEHVLGKDPNGNAYDYSPTTQVLQGTAALAEAVAKDQKGIAYGGVGYFAHRTDIKILKIKKDKDAIGIRPAAEKKVNYEDIWSGAYSISRELFMCLPAESSQPVKDFIAFVLSEEGQKIVETMEYIPLPKK